MENEHTLKNILMLQLMLIKKTKGNCLDFYNYRFIESNFHLKVFYEIK